VELQIHCESSWVGKWRVWVGGGDMGMIGYISVVPSYFELMLMIVKGKQVIGQYFFLIPHADRKIPLCSIGLEMVDRRMKQCAGL
jgi:hypothetical protein